MTRRPIFWLVFTALGVAGVATAVHLFAVALPNIPIEITMDRAEAIGQAAELSARYGWGPDDDRSAASFGQVDPEVQTYVELEGGGREAFIGLSERSVYQPYQWRVRRFAELRVEESVTRFTPDGEPYGFNLRIAQDDPGDGNLGEDAAGELAAATAAEWGVDLAGYALIESSQETLSGGRIDHTFVFERTDEAVGDARFRLRVRVAGDRAAEVTHFVQVPEAFSQRYADMRSTNDAIALVAQFVVFILYILVGAGVGAALLLRAGWLEWRTALGWAVLISLLLGLNSVNQLPLSWMSYDTALSSTSFALQQLAGGIALVLLGTPLIGFCLLAGESLGRRAFPEHVQQWRFWSRDVASSTTALGMTGAAYLLVGMQLGYVVLFYLGTQRLEGWWSPADALVQPDLLATYLPWLQAVSISLFASLWEESVFRAVPIAGAALLGARYGRRGLWIWSAVALQAVVFAAGHANYPQQPPYARVIELTVPSLVWGIVYVRFGLVPTVLAHFLYDLSLISTVLFASNALFDQGVVVAVGLLPLAVVLRARRRQPARSSPPDWAYNRAWVPAVVGSPSEPLAVTETPLAEPTHSRGLPGWAAPAAGFVGLVLVVGAWVTTGQPPRLWGTRAQAMSSAATELRARGAPVDSWSLTITTTSGGTQGRVYAYEEAGSSAAEELAGSYFGTPQWIVRLVDWRAAPEERVEEYRAWIGPEGMVSRVSHTLPEARPGVTLDESEARARARVAISNALALTGPDLVEVESEETSRPGRTDWTFTFSEPGLLTEVEGEARIRVRLAGDAVVDIARFIQVPEEWEREQRELGSRSLVMSAGLGLLLAACFGAAAVTGIVVWSRGGLSTRLVVKLGAPVLVALLASGANGWPATSAEFTTAQPWGFQAAAMVLVLVLLALMAAPAVGLVGALAHTWLRTQVTAPAARETAVAFGLLLSGVAAGASRVVASVPALGDYSGAASAIPLLDDALGVIVPYLVVTSSLLIFVATQRRFAHRPVAASAAWSLVAATAIVIVPRDLQGSMLTWIPTALAIGSVLFAALRICLSQPVLVPGITATALAVMSLDSVWTAPHAGARTGGLLAALLLAGLGWAWTQELGAPSSVSRGDAGP